MEMGKKNSGFVLVDKKVMEVLELQSSLIQVPNYYQ